MPRSTNPGNRLTAAGIAAFLDALAETGMVAEAARQAGVPRATLYRKKARDTRFAARWAAALEAGLDQLRDEAVRRAHHGVEETVWHRGAAVGTRRRYSDALLMFLLRAHQPEVYREPRQGSEELRRLAAEKWAVRTVEAQEKAVAEAFQRGKEDKSELDEILALIDGKTRTIHDEPMDPRPGTVADKEGGDADGNGGGGGDGGGDDGGGGDSGGGSGAGGGAAGNSDAGADTVAGAGAGASPDAGGGEAAADPAAGIAGAPAAGASGVSSDGVSSDGASSDSDTPDDDTPACRQGPPRPYIPVPVDLYDPRPRLARPIHEYDPYAMYNRGYGDT